jgi:hypothetical protein
MMKADDIMYRRYENSAEAINNRPKAPSPKGAAARTDGGSQTPALTNPLTAPHHRHREYTRRDREHTHHHNEHGHAHNREHKHHHHEPPKDNKNPIFSFIPTSIYDPDTRKILGFLSAEDLLIIAMILMFLDSEEEGDNLMVYALLYVLASDWIDMDFVKNFL